MRESKIEQHFVEAVTKAGGMTRKAKWLCRRGCPDRFWAFPEIEWLDPNEAPTTCFGFAEIKAPGEKPDAHQDREMARLRAMGVPVLVFDTVTAIDEWVAGMRG